ncbi:MAG: hypothetical protein WBP94_19710 [Rhodomicrobiaceae bacterium]
MTRYDAGPGQRRDNDTRTTARDDVAELFQHERRALQIDFQDHHR